MNPRGPARSDPTGFRFVERSTNLKPESMGLTQALTAVTGTSVLMAGSGALSGSTTLRGAQSPHPRRGSTTMAVGSAGHANTQSPQPVQTSASTTGWPMASPSAGGAMRMACSG